MNFIDAHLHLSDVSYMDLQKMHMMGITDVIAPSQLGAGKAVSADTIIDVWDYQLEVMVPRAAQHFIHAYSLIGISMVSTPKDNLQKLLDILPDYLKKDGVAGVGEVGFEPGSKTNNDREYQKMLLEEQMKIVKMTKKVIDIHTPMAPELKLKAAKDSLELAMKTGMDMNQVVIDHCTDTTLDWVLNCGAWAAISVQPCRNVSPRLAAQWIMKYKSNRIFVDSDTSPNMSDPLAVPKVAYELRRLGATEELIEKACCKNAKIAYRIENEG